MASFMQSMVLTVGTVKSMLGDVSEEGFSLSNGLMMLSHRFREKFKAVWAEVAKLHVLAANLH